MTFGSSHLTAKGDCSLTQVNSLLILASWTHVMIQACFTAEVLWSSPTLTFCLCILHSGATNQGVMNMIRNYWWPAVGLRTTYRRGHGELVEGLDPNMEDCPQKHKRWWVWDRRHMMTCRAVAGKEMPLPSHVALLLAFRIKVEMTKNFLNCDLHDCPWLTWARNSYLISQHALLRTSGVVYGALHLAPGSEKCLTDSDFSS